MERSRVAGLHFFITYRWELLKVPDSHPWIVSRKTGIHLLLDDTPDFLLQICMATISRWRVADTGRLKGLLIKILFYN